MKAELYFKETLSKAKRIVKALTPELRKTMRVKTSIKASTKGLEILINAKDISSLRAAVNTWLKLYKTFDKMRRLKCQKNQKKRMF